MFYNQKIEFFKRSAKLHNVLICKSSILLVRTLLHLKKKKARYLKVAKDVVKWLKKFSLFYLHSYSCSANSYQRTEGETQPTLSLTSAETESQDAATVSAAAAAERGWSVLERQHLLSTKVAVVEMTCHSSVKWSTC